jgi:hypothetical protein
MSFQCQYCLKSFSRETTLIRHVCERKRRFQQQREIGVQWGFQAYVIFYETTQTTARKTYEQFVDSSYYTAFVRFGRHCHSVHCPNFANYTQWLLKNNRRLDQWCQERNYSEWLVDYLRRENVRDALERSVETMVNYAHEHPELRNGYCDYFRLVNENKICYHIATGRISAWAVFQSRSGQDFLERLREDQAGLIMELIDPGYWHARFRDLPDDVEFAHQVLGTAGL